MIIEDLATAVALASAAALALIYAVVFARSPPSWPKTAIKTWAVVALALGGIGFGAPGWVIGGLALGAVGDFCLSRSGLSAFLAGMAAFGLGHLVYAAGFYRPDGLSGALWLGAPIALLALSTELWLAPHTGSLRWPVRAYVVIITAMALAALTLGATGGIVIVGALLFLVSDLLLALDLFVLADGASRLRPVLQVTLWVAYWGGQALILLGSLSV